MSFHDREQLTRREFLFGERLTPRPRFREVDRENTSREFWHPHQVGRNFAQSDGEEYYHNDPGRRNSAFDSSNTHRGKGPRDYRRRDERILEDINDRLCDNPYIDATEIDVEVNNGEVILTGSVNNRESKRLAEDIGESVTGVKNIENRLRVKVRG